MEMTESCSYKQPELVTENIYDDNDKAIIMLRNIAY